MIEGSLRAKARTAVSRPLRRRFLKSTQQLPPVIIRIFAASSFFCSSVESSTELSIKRISALFARAIDCQDSLKSKERLPVGAPSQGIQASTLCRRSGGNIEG